MEHAKPIRQWRASWPRVYEQLLEHLQQQWPEGRGVREFIQVLQLHRDHPARLIEQAVEQALQYHCAHRDGVKLCLQQLLQPEPELTQLDLTDQPRLLTVGHQPVQLSCYDQLLSGG